MVKRFQGISNFAISPVDLHGILAPEESIHWKNQFPCSQNTFSVQYNFKTCLYLKIFRNIIKVQGQENLQTQQLILLISTKV